MTAPASAQELLNFYAMSTFSKAAAQCGFDLPAALASAGVGVAMSESPQALLTLGGVDRLFDVCEQVSTSGHFPIVLGDNFSFDAMPEVEAFITTCPTLRVSMLALDWIPHVVHPELRLTLHEGPTMFEVALDLRGQERAHPGLVEATLATVVKFFRLVLPQREVLKEVRFAHAPRAPLSVYETYFRAPVLFGQPASGLSGPADGLDWPLRGGHPAMNAQARLLVEQRLRQLQRGESLAARLAQLLDVRNELLGAGIDDVAAALEMHPRTLQRRLQEEGTSFAQAQTRVRHDKARRLLRETDLDVEAISVKLGFTDRHSFTRAFTRWEGVSPMAYRRP